MVVRARPVVLADTNVIIEAVRSGCWPALTGALSIETVATCRDEALAGDRTRAGYVAVTPGDLARLSRVHTVTGAEVATFALAYEGADGMDDGERDLFAHAFGRTDGAWLLCSPDRASVRAAVALHWGERLISLAELAAQVGARPALRAQFQAAWLSEWRTHFVLQLGLS
jgi:hypothetical protein